MPPITLDTIVSKQTELSKLIDQLKEQANRPVVHSFPSVQIALRQGDHYPGPVLDEAGKVKHQLMLLAERPSGKLNQQDAEAWAVSVGGALPTRQELALLYANCKPHIKPEAHWSCETHEDDASHAWFCYFLNGYQLITLKSALLSVVAVRRLTA